MRFGFSTSYRFQSCAAATGGGAHRLKQLMQALFNIELEPVPEMEAVILGLLTLHALAP